MSDKTKIEIETKDCVSSPVENFVSKPTCGNCKYLLVEEADELTKQWGINTVEFCGKYQNFVKGLPCMFGKHDKLSVSINEPRFTCKYYKRNEAC